MEIGKCRIALTGRQDVITVVNYADPVYRQTQKYCTRSAYHFGADKVFEFGPRDLDFEFSKKNKQILAQKRGGGYWIWKPYVIKKSMSYINKGDFLFYIDSGSYFIRNIHILVDYMNREQMDMMSFALPFVEKQWTKAEIFDYFDCKDKKEIINSCQRMATFILFRKNKKTIRFVDRWLEAAQYDGLITDDYDHEKQDEMFIENRHDQSIFSVLAKVENIPVYKDPSEYGKQPELLSQSYKTAVFMSLDGIIGDYPQILVLHRKKKVTFYVKVMSVMRSKLPWKVYRKILYLQKKSVSLFERNYIYGKKANE